MNFQFILLFLSTLAGILCKVYDDLNDNSVFFEKNNSFFRLNKLYISETLKGMHYIILTFITTFTIYPLLVNIIANWLQYVVGRGDGFKEPYEFSGLCVFSLFFICMMFYHKDSSCTVSTILTNLFLIGLLCIGHYIVDFCMISNVEFSNTKFVSRLQHCFFWY